jgi:hypothetical protein
VISVISPVRFLPWGLDPVLFVFVLWLLNYIYESPLIYLPETWVDN